MKKIRVRWDRLAILIVILAAIVGAIVGIVYACIALFGFVAGIFSNDDANTQPDGSTIELTPEMLRCDSIMAHRVDSLFNVPQRLDTSRIAVTLYDATSDMMVYERHSHDTLAPASCMKIATALTALKTLGYDHRYTESLQIRGTMHGDTLRGNLLLRADADPLLESFDDLVKQLHRRGVRYIDGNIYYHLAKEDTLRPHPTAKTWDLPYHKLPPLLRGKRFVQRTFQYTLSINGIGYRHNKKIKPQGQYRAVAQSSHLLRDAITPMLIHSSNIKADAIMYHLDWKAGRLPSNRLDWDSWCSGGKRHVIADYLEQQFLTDTPEMPLFIINDGSGLSPENRLTADFLVAMLRYIYKDNRLYNYFVGEALATPGHPERRGSLLTRLSRPEYRNRIFVKTGTVTTIGTSSLAGYILSNDGHTYIFSIINSNSPVAESRMFQDRLCKIVLK